MYRETTIASTATAPGEGGIGIVRISGKDALSVGNHIFRMKNGKQFGEVPPFSMHYGHVADGDTLIDEGLGVFMKGPHSYTGEDVVEIQIHGSMAALRRTLRLAWHFGAVPAQRGEFTERAFLNGRLDLAQAEAVMDIIRARGDAALVQAETHLSGALSSFVHGVRDKLKDLITRLEVTIDFPEEDLEDMTLQEISVRLEPIGADLQRLIKRSETGRFIRDGMRTVIAGRPNVGKSSLLNALLQEDRAIVTDIPGTTRDTIEETISVGGVPLVLMDTAGLRRTEDQAEKIGVEKTRHFLEQADLILAVINGAEPLEEEDRKLLARLKGRRAVVIVNKSDLPAAVTEQDIRSIAGSVPLVELSARSGRGMDSLEQELRHMAEGQDAEAGRELYLMNERHMDLVRKASASVERAEKSCMAGMPADCIIVDLSEAWNDLGSITGETMDEELIHSIFSQFCVGK